MKIMRKRWFPENPYPPLCEDITYLYFISVKENEKDIASLTACLSDDELTRARKYRFEKDKNRFIVARSMIRKILGGFLCIRDSNIAFTYNKYGRPLLNPNIHDTSLEFNLSYSEDGIFIGITWNRKIGVDIEILDRKIKELVSISKNFFTSDECENICTSPVDEQNLLFLRYWVRKEAYIKAMGKGLSIPLHSFEIFLKAKPSLRFLTTEHHAAALDWTLLEYRPREDYLAAIALTGNIKSIHCYFQSISSF